MPRFIDRKGQRFGRVVCLEYKGNKKWLSKCDCGTIREFNINSLVCGLTKSCGCLSSELTTNRNTKHNLSKTRTHRIWCGMLSRCYTPSSTSYKYYGIRGIQVCDRWRTSFLLFAEDMGLCPSNELSLERLNNNGNYEPSNCVWADKYTQAANRRRQEKHV